MVEWPSGEATACKAVHTGSIPVSTSKVFPGAISSAGERFPDTEEVTGSIPVSRTTFLQVRSGNSGPFLFLCPIRAQSPSTECRPQLTYGTRIAARGRASADLRSGNAESETRSTHS